jgi:hypothetical protein
MPLGPLGVGFWRVMEGTGSEESSFKLAVLADLVWGEDINTKQARQRTQLHFTF